MEPVEEHLRADMVDIVRDSQEELFTLFRHQFIADERNTETGNPERRDIQVPLSVTPSQVLASRKNTNTGTDQTAAEGATAMFNIPPHIPVDNTDATGGRMQHQIEPFARQSAM